MPLVEAICTSCGGALKVDSSKEAAICPFCKKAYIVQDAINNYVTNYNMRVEHLHADKVVISDERSLENRIKAGETHLDMHNWEEAIKLFKSVSEDYPNDYRGWWGLVRAESQNFTWKRSQIYYQSGAYEKEDRINTYYNNAHSVCRTVSVIEDTFNKYLKAVRTYQDEQRAISDEYEQKRQMAIDIAAESEKVLREEINNVKFNSGKYMGPVLLVGFLIGAVCFVYGLIIGDSDWGVRGILVVIGAIVLSIIVGFFAAVIAGDKDGRKRTKNLDEIRKIKQDLKEQLNIIDNTYSYLPAASHRITERELEELNDD